MAARNMQTIYCVPKRIPNIIDRNLKDYQISIIFGMNIPETTGRQTTIPTSPNVCLLHYLGKMEHTI